MRKLGTYQLDQIHVGDPKQLGEEIPDQSADLVIADPERWAPDYKPDHSWLPAFSFRVLRPNRACLIWCFRSDVPTLTDAMWRAGFTYDLKTLHQVTSSPSPFIFPFAKGKLETPQVSGEFVARPYWEGIEDFTTVAIREMMAKIAAYCLPGGIILVPCSGNGDNLAAIVALQKYQFVAFERDQRIAKETRQRLADWSALIEKKRPTI